MLNSLADHFQLPPSPSCFIYFLLIAPFCVLGGGELEAINLFNLKRLWQYLSLSTSKAVKENSVNKLNAPMRESTANGAEAEGEAKCVKQIALFYQPELLFCGGVFLAEECLKRDNNKPHG